MLHRGKLLIVGMVVVAILAASLAWWHQFRRGAKVLAQWGSAHARRIRLADDCELWYLEPQLGPSAVDPANTLELGETAWRISHRVSVGRAPGFVHARQALIQDASHDWSTTPSDETPGWSYALCFRDSTGQTILVFDRQAEQTCLVDAPQTVSRLIDIGPGLVRFFEEQRDHRPNES